MADIRNSYGDVIARVEGDRAYDTYGNRVKDLTKPL